MEFTEYFMSKGYEVVTFNSATNVNINAESLFIDCNYVTNRYIHVKITKMSATVLSECRGIFVFAMRVWLYCKRF